MSNGELFITWSARILGILLLGLMVFFALTGQVPSPLSMSEAEQALSICLMLLALGSILGLFHRGGAAALILSASWCFLMIAGIDSPFALIYLYLIDGLLFLCAASCGSRKSVEASGNKRS